jgi:FkbM family methyltransferase
VSVRRFAGRTVRKATNLAGVELVPRDEGALVRLRRNGIAPAGVLDVGAALGDWSRACGAVFPAARYLLAEPLEEFGPALAAAAATLRDARVVQTAVADAPGELTFNVHVDLVGSSLLREREGGEVDGAPRTVSVTTVDALVEEHGLRPPFLLKADVQGAEERVLRGAERTLREAEAVILEVSFFSYYLGGVAFEPLLAAMHDRGFSVYDVCNLSRRPLDGALSQADVTFVRSDGPARREHVYATAAQRQQQNAEFSAAIRRRIARTG